MADERRELICAESVRKLDSQAAYVADLRGRAMTMLGIVIGASGLVGAVSAEDRKFDAWAAAAAVAFVVAVCFAVAATRHRAFRFSHAPDALYEEYVVGGRGRPPHRSATQLSS